MPVTIGYARVSTDEQDLSLQLEELKDEGAGRIYAEKISGSATDRRQLRKAIEALREGDTLLVTRLDRLARSTRDLLNILAEIGDRLALFRSVADAWANTTTAHGRLILAVLGGLAEFERDLIKSRTGAGIARAKANGVRFGRPPKLTPHQRREALARRDRGESQTLIARTYGVAPSTISRMR